MAPDEKTARLSPVGWIWKILGSLRLAVVLIAVLALILAWATILESAWGRDYAQWFVYKSPWFLALLGLLGLNIFAATALRFPWRRRTSFLITHAGLLLLLFGSVQTFLSGTEGQLTVVEGEAVDALMMPAHTRFTAIWEDRSESRAAAFIFQPGPVDWREGKTLDLGELNGVRLQVLKFIRLASAEQNWVEDESQHGAPALRFALHGSDGGLIQDQWLRAEQFGGTFSMGPASFEFQKLACATMVDDFLDPPADLGEKGVLAIHYDGKVQRVVVDDQFGKPFSLEGSDISIEIKDYLANATPSGNAIFQSEGDEPINPMLEILIHSAEGDKPVRQIAFARHPFLNFDGIHGWISPVKFWFHQAISAPDAATEFVQTPEGKLYCRTTVEGKYQRHGEVEVGQLIPAAAGFQVSVLEHLPSAREQLEFRPVSPSSRAGKNAEAAALLEVQAGGVTEQLWLKRQDSTHGVRSISTSEGSLAIGFGYDRLQLPFSLRLLKFERSKNPGRMGDASFKSQVQLVDPGQSVDKKTEISMNNPLTHGRFTFYQSSFQDLPSGKQASVLTVAYDPGRFLKYLGCLMICVGCFGMFYARALGSLTNRRNSRRSEAASTADSPDEEDAHQARFGARPARPVESSAPRESQLT